MGHDSYAKCALLGKRVRELRHAVRTGRKVPRAIRRARQARVSVLEARLAKLPPIHETQHRRAELQAQIERWRQLPPARVLTMLRVGAHEGRGSTGPVGTSAVGEVAQLLLDAVLRHDDPDVRGVACVTVGALHSLLDPDARADVARALDLAIDAGVLDGDGVELLRTLREDPTLSGPARALELRQWLSRALGRALLSQRPSPEALVDVYFGQGLGPLRFGAAPREVERVLGCPSWNGLELRAEEFKEEVHYRWAPLYLVPSAILEAVGLTPRSRAALGHCVCLFREGALFRISLRFLRGVLHAHVLDEVLRARRLGPPRERVVLVGRRVQLFGAKSALGATVDVATLNGPLPSPVHALQMFEPPSPKRGRPRSCFSCRVVER